MSIRISMLVVMAAFPVVVAVDAGTADGEGGDRASRLAARPSWENASSPRRAAAWRRLRPRMTKDDVLRILGAPPWTDRTLIFEFWMYEVPSQLASGVVVFENERVVSWRAPSSVSGSPRPALTPRA